MGDVKKEGGSLQIYLIVSLIILLVIGRIFIWMCHRKHHRMGKIDNLVANYLHKKYNKEFIVSNGQYAWATNTYVFYVFPKNGPRNMFPVFINKFCDSGISDMYKQNEI